MDETRLPSGQHWGLNISVEGLADTGTYVAATPKLIWHTTENPNFDSAVAGLIADRFQPHVAIDPHSGHVRQLIALNQYARALEHASDVPETNRAHCIQVEICGFAKDSPTWSESFYEHLGALAVMLEHRQQIERVSTRPFTTTPNRFSPTEFISAKGHLGHQHVPSQKQGHWDPGALDIHKLFDCMKKAEQKFLH